MSPAQISVCITVLNEAATLDQLLESLACQTRPADEVVVVDGGSPDRTLEVLASWRARLPLRIISLPGSTIAQGRNAAIEQAQGNIIAVTDAGVRLSEAWLERLTEPLLRGGQAAAVAGFFQGEPRSVFELAMSATVIPTEAEVRPDRFLPSSRSVAFFRRAWAEAGGYPGWLDYCEDLVFDLTLRKLGYRFEWAPRAVAHFRPRSNLGAFFLQYFRYARGDGKALLWTGRHMLRYSAYLVALLLALGLRPRWLAALCLATGAAAYCRRPYRRLRPHLVDLTPGDALKAIALVPTIRLTGDAAKMLGYPVGLLWRFQRTQASTPTETT